MSLVSESDRDRAAALLRRQFVHGRLSTEQLAERIELALAARERRDFHRAFRGLPPLWRDGDELRRLAGHARRSAVRAFAALAWALVTLILLIAFGANVVRDGVTLRNLIGFGLAWLVASAL